MFIPFDFFGEKGDVLFFAHANGYAPPTYRQFIDELTREFRVLAIRHRPLWPGSRPEELSGWADIAADTLKFLEQRNVRSVIAVGHSLGAVANLLAAVQAPDRFRALILIEPVFLDPLIAGVNHLLPNSLKNKNPLVRIALNRRHEWASREEAFAHFREKQVFSRWPDETLQDFVAFGLVDQPAGGVALGYPREWEARIYATAPRVWKVLPKVELPILGLRGGESDTISDKSWQRWGKLRPADDLREIAGAGHMLPMERPAEIARLVTDFIHKLPAAAGAPSEEHHDSTTT